jgi:hypothetical protein
MNTNQKCMLALFLSIFTIALCAMNRAPQTPPPTRRTAAPESPQSPGERRMRQQHLVRHLGQQINPAIYTVLPRAQVVPPNLDVPTDQIVNDWFFDHMTAEQLAIINRVAGVIRQNGRVPLTEHEVQLYLGFPSGIRQDLRPYLSIPETETAPTEVDTSSSHEVFSTSKKRKK